jgi:general secretion pathway protein I
MTLDPHTSTRNRGFTLLEVMVAMGILAISYVTLLETQSASIRLSTFGRQTTAAIFLAQYKMEETEEKLLKDGFPETDQDEDGNFEEQGYPGYRWKIQVKKIELPLGEALNSLLSAQGRGEAGQKGGSPGTLGEMKNLSDLSNKLPGQLGGMLKDKLGSGGLAGGISSLLNPDMLKGNLEMLSKMLEQAIREVQLTVLWEDGGPGKEFSVTTHLVQVPQASAAAGAQSALPGQPGASGTASPGFPSTLKTVQGSTAGTSGLKLSP